jgi:O-antigen ligase
MATLIGEIGRKLFLSVTFTVLLGITFDDILAIGDDSFQSLVVISFYTYVTLTLFTFSKHKLFHVLAVPVLSQFIHIFQRFSFTVGANSLWRLAPFIILNLYLIYFFTDRKILLSPNQRLFIFSWVILHSFFLLISPNLEMIFAGGIILYLFTLPLYFLYLSLALTASNFRTELEKYLTLLFAIMAAGTFGLIYFGAEYKGSDNLLASRNIADTNVTMAYFILMWPFTVSYGSRQRFPSLHLFLLSIAFLTIVIFSFSRGSALLIVPYLFLTLILRKGNLKFLLPIFLLVCIEGDRLLDFFTNLDLAYFWSLRFADFFSSGSLWDRMQTASGRIEIQNIAFELFVRNPLYGHGIGSFEVLGPGFREAHSLFYTLLAEGGLVGSIYYYAVFLYLFIYLSRNLLKTSTDYAFIPISFLFYLAYSHTVGSIFVIIPAKSISVNCIAPVLLLCQYFYTTKLELEGADIKCPAQSRNIKTTKFTP